MGQRIGIICQPYLWFLGYECMVLVSITAYAFKVGFLGTGTTCL